VVIKVIRNPAAKMQAAITESMEKIRFSKGEQKLFILTLLSAILCSIYLIANDITYTDFNMASELYLAGGWELSCGRWLWIFLDNLRWGLSSIVVSTIIASVCISFASVLLIRLFCIEGKIARYLTCILLATAPFFYDLLSSFFCSGEFIFGFLLSVLSVYILYSCDHLIVGILLGGVCVACSMGIYQSYIGVTCGLCVMIPLLHLLKKDKDVVSVMKQIGDSLIMGIVGAMIYYLVLVLLLRFYNCQMASYSGMDKIVGLQAILQIPSLVGEAFNSFYQYFFGDKIINNSTYNRGKINFLIFAVDSICLLILIFRGSKSQKKTRLKLGYGVIVVICILLIPLALGVIELLVPNRDIGQFMCAPYTLLLYFSFALVECLDMKIWKQLAYFVMSGVMLIAAQSYFVMENASFMAARIKLDQTEVIANDVVQTILASDEYDKGMKVLFVGAATDPVFDNSSGVFQLASGQTSSFGQVWNNSSSSICWKYFIRYHMGIEFEIASQDEYLEVIQQTAFKDMPAYPDRGAIKVIDDMMVVKLTDQPVEY